VQETLDLWDYRRRVAELYGAVRRASPGAAAWRRWRRDRDALFRGHPQSALAPERRAAFDGLCYFPYDPAWRFVAELEPAAGEPIALQHSDDNGATAGRPFAVARFLAADVPCALTLYWLEAYSGGVFLPFRDATSGEETYAGGRYLLDTAKGADLGGDGGSVVLDFNYAYHPSCAYDARWSCPLAPVANRLAVAVRAGERLG
jgi:uncharacterized protein (DUF1684 family)